jgi:hypothetical protein
LGKQWRWDTAKTYRFIEALIAENMLKKVKRFEQRFEQRQAQHFIICNYETYNPTRNSENNGSDNGSDNKYNKDKRKTKERKIYTGEIVSRIPTKDGIEFEVTEELVKEFEATYAKVDVRDELKKIRMWAISNPEKKWTLKGSMKGINSWLSRDADKTKAQNLFAGLGNLGEIK